MNEYVKVFNKFSPIQKNTVYDVFKTHFKDQEGKLDELIDSALEDPNTNEIGQGLQWLHNGKTPKDVLKELSLDDFSILTSKSFSRLLEYIDSYNIINFDHPITLYDTMLSCFGLDILKIIVAEGKKSKNKPTKFVAYQLSWMIEEREPKKLFMTLQAEKLHLHYRNFEKRMLIFQDVPAIIGSLEDPDRTKISHLLEDCASKKHTHDLSTNSIDQRIRELLKEDWVKSNDELTKFLTQLRETLQYGFFRSWQMEAWIAYVNAYIKRKPDIRMNELVSNTVQQNKVSFLIRFTTFEESDVIRMVFRQDAPRRGATETIWLNDLIKRWLHENKSFIGVFEILEVAKVEDFIKTARFQECLTFYKAFLARRNDPVREIILQILMGSIETERLKNALDMASKCKQTRYLVSNVTVNKELFNELISKASQKSTDLKTLRKALTDAAGRSAVDIGVDTRESKRSRNDR